MTAFDEAEERPFNFHIWEIRTTNLSTATYREIFPVSNSTSGKLN